MKKAIRESMQEEIENEFSHSPVTSTCEHLTEEQTEERLSKTWVDVSEVFVTSGEMGDLFTVVSDVKELGYYVNSTILGERIILEICQSIDVWERHKKQVEEAAFDSIKEQMQERNYENIDVEEYTSPK